MAHEIIDRTARVQFMDDPRDNRTIRRVYGRAIRHWLGQAHDTSLPKYARERGWRNACGVAQVTPGWMLHEDRRYPGKPRFQISERTYIGPRGGEKWRIHYKTRKPGQTR